MHTIKTHGKIGDDEFINQVKRLWYYFGIGIGVHGKLNMGRTLLTFSQRF